MKLENLQKVFANHPDLPAQLMTTYASMDPLARERGFHQFNSARIIILKAAAQNDTTFLEAYINAIMTEQKVNGDRAFKGDVSLYTKCDALLSELCRAKTSVFTKNEIKQLIEYRDVSEIEEKAHKIAEVMLKINAVFGNLIAKEQLTRFDQLSESKTASRKLESEKLQNSLNALLY